MWDGGAGEGGVGLVSRLGIGGDTGFLCIVGRSRVSRVCREDIGR